MRWVTLRSRTLFATTLLMALASAHVARADSTTEAAALKQFEAGRAAFDQQDYAAALTAFTASLQGLPSPNTRLYIARCQRALGRTASAYTSYRLAAREATDRLNATGEKRYAATKEAAAAEAAEIEKSVPHLEIRLPADAPPTTIVKLDDVELAHATLGSLDVDPGPHVVVASAPRGAIALFFITDWSGDNPAKKRMGRIEPLLGPFGAGARGTF